MLYPTNVIILFQFLVRLCYEVLKIFIFLNVLELSLGCPTCDNYYYLFFICCTYSLGDP